MDDRPFKEFVAEFIGTFILLIIGHGTMASHILKGIPTDMLSVSLSYGVGAMIGIIASSHISGGHINPAVTVAMVSINKFPLSKVWYYLIAQYLGGFMASVTVFVTYFDGLNSFNDGILMASGTNNTAAIFSTYPASFLTVSGALITEIIGTASLMFAVLAVTKSNGNAIPAAFHPVIICLTITGICMSFGLNTGAILNPARDLTPRLFTAIGGWGWEPFKPLGGHYWWVAGVLGPHIGAVLGAWIYIFTCDTDNLRLVFSQNQPHEHHQESTNKGFANIGMDSVVTTATKSNSAINVS